MAVKLNVLDDENHSSYEKIPFLIYKYKYDQLRFKTILIAYLEDVI